MSDEVLRFTFDSPGVPRIVFGTGTRARLEEEVERLQMARPLLVCTAGRAELARGLAAQLGGATVFAGARQHVPASVLAEARSAAAAADADGYVTIGGGSATGVAKAMAVESGLPIVAMPTTYSGSELTPIWGVTDGGSKRTSRDERALPRTVLLDPELTLDFPPELAGPSGINALAHCVEALYASDANPLTSLLAGQGIPHIMHALPVIAATSGNMRAREEAMYGSCLGGLALASVAMGLHHRICHVLGGAFDLPHAETHAVVLPHAVSHETRLPDAGTRRVAAALGDDEPSVIVHELRGRIGAPASLRAIGLEEHDVPRAIRLVSELSSRDGRTLGNDAESLVRDAFEGHEPRRWS
jgi:maleylacetate reductase